MEEISCREKYHKKKEKRNKVRTINDWQRLASINRDTYSCELIEFTLGFIAFSELTARHKHFIEND
ncbi:hypothetical protein KIN20_020413 [Parelaphostrongylus tenuis]|uniref:Uncharacterized protein n=1 Tax=Parelaphostrongylus tenuis TaxID=148309 RepID=A0AAD5N9T4_PARTN|nr:hypothetical protein KIN20_020413 [Parelaphostrongylus tenuis]